VRLANDYFYVCAPTPLQFATAAGFALPAEHFRQMQRDFQVRRDQLCEALARGGFRPLIPQGAYYVLADVTELGSARGREFAMRLLEKVKVAGVSGESFYASAAGSRYIRFNFALERNLLDEACDRLAKTKEVM
jgi:aminotransferase